MCPLYWYSSPEPSPENFSIGRLGSSAGQLCVCAGGVDIIKLTKIPPIYSVSRFNLGGLGALYGGLIPPKTPVAAGLLQSQISNFPTH